MTERHFQVMWTLSAVQDLEALAAYVARDSRRAADGLLKRMEERAASLATSPRRGRVVPELAAFGMKDWRELILRPYRLIYRIFDDRVYVLAVLDGRRDLEDLLLERLLRTDT